MKKKITTTFCKSLYYNKYDTNRITDDSQKGFQVRVGTFGVLKFYYNGRDKNDVRRDCLLGEFGAITVAQARVLAVKKKLDLKSGFDPKFEKELHKAKPTVAEAAEKFICEHVKNYLKPATAAEYIRHLHKEIIPRFGSMKVEEVSLKHLKMIHLDIQKDYSVKANRVNSTFSKFLSWCEEEELRAPNTNPSHLIGRSREVIRDRRLSKIELGRLKDALLLYQREQPLFVDMIRLLMLTMCRKDEIRTLKWDDVNYDLKRLELPDSKNDKKTVPLNDKAISILKKQSRVSGNPYVFVGNKIGKPIVNVKKRWKHVCSMANIDNLWIHDLRRSSATFLREEIGDIYVVSKQLTHKDLKTTQRYLGIDEDEQLLAINKIDFIAD